MDYGKIDARWKQLKNIKVSLANKFWTDQVVNKAKELPQEEQQRLLDVVMGGLCNDDSGVGAYATRP